MSKEGNFDIIFKEIVESEEWAEIESSLLMYLMLLLVRGKGIKRYLILNLIYLKNIRIFFICYLLQITL